MSGMQAAESTVCACVCACVSSRGSSVQVSNDVTNRSCPRPPAQTQYSREGSPAPAPPQARCQRSRSRLTSREYTLCRLTDVLRKISDVGKESCNTISSLSRDSHQMTICDVPGSNVNSARVEYDYDYDYTDESDPFWEYRLWKEQSAMGKGQKIGEKPPAAPDPILSEGESDTLSSNRAGNPKDRSSLFGTGQTWQNRPKVSGLEDTTSHPPTTSHAALDLPAGAVGRGVLPAVHIALQHVNNDTRMQRKYTLKMASNDTKLSYADTNPMLSDRDKFPNFYRTVPSDSDFNPARLALLRHFNWTTVATLFQDAKLGRARYGYAHNRFDSLMEKNKINISIVESFADDPEQAIKNLKAHDVRIIVGNFDQSMARRVFCSAHQHSMYGAKHQWIILGTYDPDWWTVEDDSIPCSPQQLNHTLHGYLATDVLPLSTSDEITESGKTSGEYLELYESARGQEFSKYHGYAYDGVWVVAKALDRLLDGTSMTPDLFRGPLVGKVLNETSFQGVTGRVQFLNGDRVGSTTILQMQFGSMEKVGEYHALYDSLDFSDGKPIVWRDRKPPVDRSIKIDELRHVSVPVYIGLVVMAAFGITMAVLFLALNIRFRNHRYIKMSSPNMNNLIIIGCILCYVSIILLGADPDHHNPALFAYLCTVPPIAIACLCLFLQGLSSY
ncbi:gamma-aminobutyric acid type B receptor subunit 2-like [Aplysia californica]|uniref:Gamma-aminobutyric acid type B receptor subunit 2-like n=1 Tax=Aplysia californica TaxID=6500 RepID=A0ABM1W1P5_APLCA|nr:gamma-aminobutyric acid type B receptor subunit 2-like [Aplysia californica]